jgi:transcriptional regulator with XRE-family HTH domain
LFVDCAKIPKKGGDDLKELEKMNPLEMAVDDNVEVRRVIGTNLKRLRESQGLTRDELGKQMGGISPYTVRNFESGEKSPKVPALVKYADYFDVSLDEIFGRGEWTQKKLLEWRLQRAREIIEQFVDVDLQETDDKIKIVWGKTKFFAAESNLDEVDPPASTYVIEFTKRNFVAFVENSILRAALSSKTLEEFLVARFESFFGK